MRLSNADRAIIRTQPHSSAMWLSVYQPRIVFAAQINDVDISRGARVIPYDTVTTGSFNAVFDDAMLVVGTAPGDDDIGRIRVRSASAGSLVVAENSHIEWANNQYLTVLNFIDIEAIYPRIISDPNNDENVIFYKDYDIPYTNQNSVLGTFVCMGPHRAGWVGEDMYWSSSGTYNVRGENLSYHWAFGGGTPSTYDGPTPGLVTYNTPGHYKTRLIVSGTSAGSTDTGYRFVSIYDRPGEGDQVPIVDWEMSDLNGSRDSGGYVARIKIRDTTVANIQDNSLVVIFSEDYYGSTKKSLGGNAENCSSIFFVGYILKGSISYNYQDNYVEFSVGSVSEVMKVSEGFSVSCEDKATPTTWFEIQNLSVQRAIYHYLRWHSTVLKVADFQYMDDDRIHQYLDTDRNSLYDAINSFLSSGVVGKMVADRQGKLWGEIDVRATWNARSAFPIAFSTFSNIDWMGTPTLEERTYSEMSFLEMGGIAYNGSGIASGSSTALLASAPGEAPRYHGRLSRQEGLILNNQLQLNRIVGAVFAYENSRFPSLSLDLRGNYSNMDIAPNEVIWLDLAATDTPRGIVLTNEPFHVTSMSWRYIAERQFRGASAYFAQVVNGITGTAIHVPPIPDDGFKNPRIDIPPIIPFGGGGAPPAEYYTHVFRSTVPSINEERKRGAFTATSQTFASTGNRHVTVPSAGVYIAGVLASAYYTTVSQVLSISASIVVDPTPYFFAVSDDTSYHDHDDIGAGAIGAIGNTSTILVLDAGDVVKFSYTMGTSVGTTLIQFSVWLVKISD